LKKALKWSQQSIAAALSPENADTHAHILYKLGKTKKLLPGKILLLLRHVKEIFLPNNLKLLYKKCKTARF